MGSAGPTSHDLATIAATATSHASQGTIQQITHEDVDFTARAPENMDELIEFADQLLGEHMEHAEAAMDLAALWRAGHKPTPHPPPAPIHTKGEAAAALFKSVVLAANQADGQAQSIGRLWA